MHTHPTTHRRAELFKKKILHLVHLVPVWIFATLISPEAIGQTPGIIFKPAGQPGQAILDPNNDGYVSATPFGFSGVQDTGPGNSEINYRSLPQLKIEPMTDLGPGPGCKFTDFADTGNKDAAGFFVNSTNDFLFRFRLGGSAPNAKGYSILIDADQRFGTTGAFADSNAVTGNPGFEIEVVLTTGGTTPGVNVYAVDGRSFEGGGAQNPTAIITGATLPVENYSLKAIAATTACGDLDVFYDFFVPYTYLQAAYPGFSTVTPIRMVANTVIAPKSALYLSQVSDLAGLETANFGSNITAAWTALVQSSPVIQGNTIQGGGNFGALRSEPPVVNATVTAGATNVSGTSVESPGTSISVYLNGVASGTTTVQANGTWSINFAGGLTTGHNVYATAQNSAAGETVSLQSNIVTVGGNTCSGNISRPVASITCTSTKGIMGTVSPGVVAGTIIKLYAVTPGGINELPLGTLQPVTDASGSFFAKCNSATQNCNSGQSCFSGTYLLTTTEPGKCESGYSTSTTVCVGTSSSSNAPVINTSSVKLGSNSISGTFSYTAAPATVFLFGNGQLIGSYQFTGSAGAGIQNWTINVAYITAGMTITAMGVENGKCLSFSSNTLTAGATPVTISAPILTGQATISGTSVNPPGTVVSVFRNGTSNMLGTTVVTSTGTWSAAVSGLSANDVITAYVSNNAGSLISTVSNAVTVLPQAAGAPVITSVNLVQGATQVSGTYAGAATTLLLYEDDYLIGTAAISGGNWTVNLSNSAGAPALYAGGIIYATAAQAGTYYESARSNTVTIGCGAIAANNSVSPAVTTICSGNPATVVIANPVAGLIYTLKNADGTADKGSSAYVKSGTSSITLQSVALITTQTLRVAAEEIGAVICRQLLSTPVQVTVKPNTQVNLNLSTNSPACDIASITVHNASSGYNYELYSQSTGTLLAMATGANADLTFTTPLPATTAFYVNAVEANTNCTTTLNNTVTVSQNCPAVYSVKAPSNWYDNPNGSTLASVTDQDGGIISAELVSSSLPAASISINTQNGAVLVAQRGQLRPGSYGITLRTTDALGSITENTITVIFTGDRDNDLVPDFTDVDNNNDGLTDLISSKDALAFADADTDGNLNFADPDFVHPYYGVFTDENSDGLNDWFDADTDGIINNLDLDIDSDGLLNSIEANSGQLPSGSDAVTGQATGLVSANGMPVVYQTFSGSGITVFPNPDTDQSGLPDFLDLDSDTDGQSDRLEAQFIPGITPLGTDQNRDGLDDAFDALTSGTLLVPVDIDYDNVPDYLDRDNDGFQDTHESIDLNGNGISMDDFISLSNSFSGAGGNPEFYNNGTDVNSNQIPDWLEDLDDNKIPNFLDYNSIFFRDSNKNGMVDLLDEKEFGTTPIPPDNNSNGIPDFRDSGMQTTLPVELISFSASLMKEMVLLKWETAMELQTDYFELERSNNGRHFQAIGRVAAQGNSTHINAYSFIDSKPNQGINYYRIRQVDLNKDENLSRIAAVTIGKNIAATVDAFPNPFTEKLRIRIMSPTAQELQFRVLDTRGISLFAENINVHEGTNVLDYNFENLSPGVYMFTFTGQDSLIVKRMVKE